MDQSLNPFFNPKGVAVVGASGSPQKLGYGLTRNLILSDYQGAIHLVNPKGGELFEREVHTSIKDIPDPVDLAVFLIPAAAVPESLIACGQRGIKAVIIASGGFRETGPAGQALERECAQIAKQNGIRMIGPNCIGLLDTHLPLDTTFLPPPGPTPGKVAFISHSGAICAAVIDWARGQGFGLSRLVSLGNQIDVTETDVLKPVAGDKYTKVITMYLEGVSDGREFVVQASEVAKNTPILALKVGRYKGGQEAVASHTGALAGEERAFNAAFRRAGVIRADTSEEMFDWARALAWCPPPKGRRVAVLTNAGGPGVTAVDALEGMGLSLSQFSADTTTKLKELLPPAASVGNPVDMLATASPDQYRQCLQVLLKDEGVDSVLVILPPPPAYTSAGVANAMIPVIQTTSKPVLVALMGERLIQEAVVRLRAAHIPEYRFPERAASALNVLVRREESLQRKAAETVQRTDVDKQAVQRLLDDQPAGDFLPTEISHGILKAYGLPVLEMHLAQTKDQAAALADKVGFPVVMKIASPDIQHKSDMGGVLVNLETAEQVAEGYDRLMQIAAKAGEGINILGVHIQKMAPKGQEIIVGAVRDAQFGALVMFGSGGVEVEGLKDVEFSLAPVTQDDISSMFDNTWAGQRMAGFRNLPAGDRTAVEDALIRIGQLAADFPQLAEIEMNPMTVLENGKGAVAVDVRIKVKS